jgi:hypothetical protein
VKVQRTRKLALTITVTALAGLVTLGISAVAQARKAQTSDLHLVESGGGLRFIDNPPKAARPYNFSAGDIVIVTRDVSNLTGKRAGSLRLVCIAVTATVQQCNGTESLGTGTLQVAGTSTPAPATTVAIIGGTGAYAGARGTSVSKDRNGNSNVADQTISLFP